MRKMSEADGLGIVSAAIRDRILKLGHTSQPLNQDDTPREHHADRDQVTQTGQRGERGHQQLASHGRNGWIQVANIGKPPVVVGAHTDYGTRYDDPDESDPEEQCGLLPDV